MIVYNPSQNHDTRLDSRVQPKRPTQFMFIDSSHGGVNAKPDKNVRSFVMKSARTKKTWSTRPRSPKKDSSADLRAKRRPSVQAHLLAGPGALIGNSPQPGGQAVSAEEWRAVSPKSTYSDSIVSCCNSDYLHGHNTSCSTSPGTEYECIDGRCSMFALQQESSLHQTPLTNGLQSFDCLPVRLDSSSHSLLHQFITTAAPRVIPIDPHHSSGNSALGWIRGCIQSPVGAPFIYAVLTSSARAAQLESEKYKWLAMSAVNELLSNARTSTNDSTISAVLVLLAIEEADLADPRRKGSERECSLMVNDAHYNGIKTMIQQRGGLAALSGNRVLQVCLLMHSIAQAITTFKRPYAVLVDTSGHVEDYAIITNQSPRDFGHILRHFRVLNLDRSLLKIIFAITIFVADLTVWYETGICAVDSLDLQKHASLLMYRLFEWYQQSEEHSPGFYIATIAINQSVCLALLIFMVNATEPNAGASGSRLSKTVTRLRQSLQKAPLQLWSSAPNLLLWVSSMGALGVRSLPKAHKVSAKESSLMFYANCIRSGFIGEQFGYETPAEQLLDRMRSCLWISSVFDERAKILWASMGLCGSSLPEVDDVSSSEGEQVEDEYALGQSTTLRFFTTDKGRI